MLNFKNISYGYSKNRLVFSDLDLKIEKGKIYGLLGKNGAGKTTLLKLASGLLFPKYGEISALGGDPKDRTPEFLSDFFFIPEDFLMPRLTPFEYASNYGHFYQKFDSNQFTSILQKLEVNPMEKMHRMSFGQQKKAYIAFAIACNTSILIMDEPTNGLDIPSKAAFRRVIAAQMNEDRTMIISTHQVRDLDRLIDTVVILEDRAILLNASIDQITQKLIFKHIQDHEKPIYCEQTIHGNWGVLKNTEHIESQVDMEILFNAAMVNHDFFKANF